MRFFVFATFFVLWGMPSVTYGFFIPKNAMMPMQENLKPLDKSLSQRGNEYSQRRYQVRDGRVIALENEKPLADENDAKKMALEVREPTDETDTLVETSADTLEKPSQTPDNTSAMVFTPLAAPVDNALPAYKNRYAMYLNDLDVFRRTKKMPDNPDLNATLSKVSAPHSKVLFSGSVN